MPAKYTPEQRIAAFWKNTHTVLDRSWGGSPCQHWHAAIDRGGYGTFGGEKAHRFAYALAHGTIPNGLLVCHRCDEQYPAGDRTYRRCVNPAHLFLGTHQDNSDDAVAKGRMATGARSGRRRFKDHWPSAAGAANGRAQLTDKQVREICQRRKDGQTLREIATALGVGSGTVSNIVKGRTWTHITGGESAPDIRSQAGKYTHGEANSTAKLTENDVRAIRQRAAAGESRASIAVAFGISKHHVTGIVKRRSWRHV